MSKFQIFLAHPHYSVLFHGKSTKEARMGVVASLRQHATMILKDAVNRIPPESQTIIDALRAKGHELAWNLNSNDHATRFYFTLRKSQHSPEELEASELLLECVFAQEAGDISDLSEKWDGRRLRPQLENSLAAGRKKGAKKQQDAAKLNRKKIERAAEDLFSNPQCPHKTIDQKAHFILTYDNTYKLATIIGIVKQVSARVRKAKK